MSGIIPLMPQGVEHEEREMQVHVHVHMHESSRYIALLERLCSTLDRIGASVAQSLDALTAEVTAVRTVHESAVRLIEGIAQRILDAGVDPAQLQGLVDELHASSMALATAVDANTVPPVVPPDMPPVP